MNVQQMAVWILFGLLTSSSATRVLAQELELDGAAAVGGGFSDTFEDDASQIQPYEYSPVSSGDDALPAPNCSLCPSVYGSVESLFLERNNGSRTQPVVITGTWPTAYTTIISTQDLQFGFEPGLRALLGARLQDGWAIESSYLALFESQSTAFAEGNGIILPGGPWFRTADDMEMRVGYASQLHTVDLNLVQCRWFCDDRGDGPVRCKSFEWMAGLRYLNLTEAFGIAGESSSCPLCAFTYDIRTRNNLYGAQLGARYRRCRGRWSLEVTGKAGVYLNDAQQQQQIVDFEGRPFRNSNARGIHAAFVGELNVSGIYHLTDVWGLRAGYNLIGIEGIALAPDQLDFNADPAGGHQLDRTGGVLLHGVSFGLEARW